MQISQIAFNLIKQFEGCRLQAYPDPATGGIPWTIGYGATGANIVPGLNWTQDQADQDLESRVENLEMEICDLIIPDLNDNQWGAVLSLTYNIGVGAFKSSTLLGLLNQSDFENAAKQFLVWDKAAGQVNQGLLNRRQKEMAIFLS